MTFSILCLYLNSYGNKKKKVRNQLMSDTKQHRQFFS
jgi:hypothetical protein